MEKSKQFELTIEGREKLVEELAEREGSRREEIIARVKEARAFGDLSENAEYDAAKEEQAKNEARIAEIRKILSVATVVEDLGDDLSVSIGTTVTLKGPQNKKSVYTIVGTMETNSLEHRISNESPVGGALIGHKEGDTVSVTSPSGKVTNYTILSIAR